MRTFQHTKAAKAGDGFNILVEFADGTSGVFDFSPYLKYPCYAPLRDRAFFVKVAAGHGTLYWPNDIDIAPEAVWAQAVRGNISSQNTDGKTADEFPKKSR